MELRSSINRMKPLREEKGLNMKEAAAALQLPYTTYRNHEQGLREPNSETLVQIANFYGVSVDYLIGRSASRNAVMYDRRPVPIPPGFQPMPEMAAVRIGDEATLKRVYYDGQNLTLVPCNTAYRPKTYSGPDLDSIQIEGRMVGFTHWGSR